MFCGNNSNSCEGLIWILILLSCCGNNNFLGDGDCGCGESTCGGGYLWIIILLLCCCNGNKGHIGSSCGC